MGRPAGAWAEAMNRRSGEAVAACGEGTKRGTASSIKVWLCPGEAGATGVGLAAGCGTRGGGGGACGGGGGSSFTTSTGTSTRAAAWWPSAATVPAVAMPATWRATEIQIGQPMSRASTPISPPRTSGVGPATQEVVVAGGERDHAGVIRLRLAHLADGHVEIEQQAALAVVAHHALDPEDRSEADAPGHRLHPVQAARGVEDHVARRQLH